MQVLVCVKICPDLCKRGINNSRPLPKSMVTTKFVITAVNHPRRPLSRETAIDFHRVKRSQLSVVIGRF